MNKNDKIAIVGDSKMLRNALTNCLNNKGFQNISDTMSKGGYVFHIGGSIMGLMENVRTPADLHVQNLQTQLDIIPVAHKLGVKKLLYLATNCVYPENAPQPYDESYLMTGKLEPISEPSSITRVVAIKMCQYFRRQYGCDFISAVPSGMYGDHDDFCPETGHVLPAMITRMHVANLKGDKSVTFLGTGTPRRDWIHTEDVADACIFLMENYEGEEQVNIPVGVDYSLKELVKIVASVVGYKGEIKWDTSRPDGAKQKLLGGTKLYNMGWRPKVGIQEGVEKLYEWFKEQGECVYCDYL